ncbi:MAG: hypothetical protein NT062_35820 [Proteobacteria bacterium]|nr:hypothetical protein [Pseudomonadota bacterium]
MATRGRNRTPRAWSLLLVVLLVMMTVLAALATHAHADVVRATDAATAPQDDPDDPDDPGAIDAIDAAFVDDALVDPATIDPTILELVERDPLDPSVALEDRHARPSRWGRLDLELAWRHTERMADIPSTQRNELWLLATWSH